MKIYRIILVLTTYSKYIQIYLNKLKYLIWNLLSLFYSNSTLSAASSDGRNKELAKKLWSISAKLVGLED